MGVWVRANESPAIWETAAASIRPVNKPIELESPRLIVLRIFPGWVWFHNVNRRQSTTTAIMRRRRPALGSVSYLSSTRTAAQEPTRTAAQEATRDHSEQPFCTESRTGAPLGLCDSAQRIWRSRHWQSFNSSRQSQPHREPRGRHRNRGFSNRPAPLEGSVPDSISNPPLRLPCQESTRGRSWRLGAQETTVGRSFRRQSTSRIGSFASSLFASGHPRHGHLFAPPTVNAPWTRAPTFSNGLSLCLSLSSR